MSQLFSEKTTINLAGTKYEIKFPPRALIYLEHKYKKNGVQVAHELLRQLLDKGVMLEDSVNLIYAGLIHIKQFNDEDAVLDLIEINQLSKYANAIATAIIQTLCTPDQLEKLETFQAKRETKNAEEPTPN